MPFTGFRGIMRMTLTVVVIMFELTGALTYILPTMVRMGIYLYGFLIHGMLPDCLAGDKIRWRLHWHGGHCGRDDKV